MGLYFRGGANPIFKDGSAVHLLCGILSPFPLGIVVRRSYLHDPMQESFHPEVVHLRFESEVTG